MRKPQQIPVTPEVIAWAIAESGYKPEELATKLGQTATAADLEKWMRDRAKPTLSQFRKLASVLKRTPATFLLPAAPQSRPLRAEFRHSPNSERTQPSPEERRYLREAIRLQETTRWILQELADRPVELSRFQLGSDVELVAEYTRDLLEPRLPVPRADWVSNTQAFHGWRSAMESVGMLIFTFPLGKKSARGFSLWDERAPLIAVNTAWNHAARSFTLFHEFGHLLTRTSSVCLERLAGPRLSQAADHAERWCESFAAAALLPWVDVEGFLRARFRWAGAPIQSVDIPRAIANRFKVSWRAATIRLIERGVASWDLYAKVPPVTEQKSGGGGGDGGRDRGQIRLDEYGHRTIRLFVRAMERDVISRSDALDYLDVPDVALDRFEKFAATGR